MSELYDAVTTGFGSYVCRRCGALVFLSPEARRRHDDWHDGVAEVARVALGYEDGSGDA